MTEIKIGDTVAYKSYSEFIIGEVLNINYGEQKLLIDVSGNGFSRDKSWVLTKNVKLIKIKT